MELMNAIVKEMLVNCPPSKATCRNIVVRCNNCGASYTITTGSDWKELDGHQWHKCSDGTFGICQLISVSPQ
jgi:hypothetical protein